MIITFENHGKTIPQQQLNTIFEKFHRLDESRLTDTGGVGLGLSTAEEIILYMVEQYPFKAERKRLHLQSPYRCWLRKFYI